MLLNFQATLSLSLSSLIYSHRPRSLYNTILLKKKKEEANMEFCLNVVTEGILEELIKNPEENVVMSPASMNVLLNMVASGSAGKTLEQFLRILGAKNITDLNSDSLSLMALLDQSTAKNAPVLSMVNAMFVEQRQSFRLKPSFQEMVRKIYKTEPKMVDFTQVIINFFSFSNTKFFSY